MFSRLLLAASVVLLVVTGAQAQQRRGGAKPQMSPFAAQGTVQAVKFGAIQMLTNTNQTWIVFVDQKSKISVTGTAEADFLRPGLFVQFSVELDKRGKAQAPVSKLTIFTPTEQAQIGIWPVGSVPVPGAADNPFGAGAANPQPRSKGPVAGEYAVHGRITSVRKDKYTVYAGRGAVQIELADIPQINVDFADYSVVQKGDAITVSRGQFPQGMMGRAKASELSIVLSDPLTGPRKKKPVRTKPPEQPEGPEGPDDKPEKPDEKNPKPSGVQPE